MLSNLLTLPDKEAQGLLNLQDDTANRVFQLPVAQRKRLLELPRELASRVFQLPPRLVQCLLSRPDDEIPKELERMERQLDELVALFPDVCNRTPSLGDDSTPTSPNQNSTNSPKGAAVGGPPAPCPGCQTALRAYNGRNQAEHDIVAKYDSKDTGEGKAWYVVDALWLGSWKRYMSARSVTDIRDMCAPGPITNWRLFSREDPGTVRRGLKQGDDYFWVNARVWWTLMHAHGGGPIICRSKLSIYSEEVVPELSLMPEELRGDGELAGTLFYRGWQQSHPQPANGRRGSMGSQASANAPKDPKAQEPDVCLLM